VFSIQGENELNDTPDVIHGRMKEGAHIAGYSLQRSMENLRWLLEDSRFEQLAGGYKNVNDFLRDTQDAFKLLNIRPEERKQIAELVKELQPKASQRAIGELMGVNADTVARDLGYERPAGNTALLHEEMPENAVNTAPAIPPDDYFPTTLELNRQNNPALYTSNSDQWNTPKEIIEKVLQVISEIDLDPCSNSDGDPNVPAHIHLTAEDNGLAYAWDGKVYMNPPYGKEIIDWVTKLVDSYKNGDVSEAIALVPSRTDTEWFRKFREYPRCFIWGRLKFSDNGNPAPFPSMAVYLGNNLDKFIGAFKDIGDVYCLQV